MARKKLSKEAQMFKLALTGMPESYYHQRDLPEKLARLLDVCLCAARLAPEEPQDESLEKVLQQARH